jgi:hypothetical protein
VHSHPHAHTVAMTRTTPPPQATGGHWWHGTVLTNTKPCLAASPPRQHRVAPTCTPSAIPLQLARPCMHGRTYQQCKGACQPHHQRQVIVTRRDTPQHQHLPTCCHAATRCSYHKACFALCGRRMLHGVTHPTLWTSRAEPQHTALTARWCETLKWNTGRPRNVGTCTAQGSTAHT